MFSSKRRRKSYNCFAKEVQLKTVLFGATEVHTHMANVKEYPLPRVYAQPRAIEFLWQKFSAFFRATISLRKFPSPPQRKIWLCDSSLSPYATMTFTMTLLRNLARALKR